MTTDLFKTKAFKPFVFHFQHGVVISTCGRAKLQSGLRRDPMVLSLELPQVRIPAKEYNFPFKCEVEQNKRTKLIREQFRSHLRTH